MENSFNIRKLCLGLFSFILIATSEAQVHMPANVFVNENDSVPVTCNTTKPADIVNFSINKKICASIFPKENCTLLYANVFCRCENLTVITCMTTIMKRNDHGHNITFSAQYGSQSDGSSAVIRVIVPIKQATISADIPDDIFINASNPMSLSCEALNGIPTPRIAWFLTNTSLSSTIGDFTVNITSSSKPTVVQNSDNTDSVTSTLMFVVNKTENGMRIYCSASNVKVANILSRMIRLHVQYKTQEVVFINNKPQYPNYYMIRNSETVQKLQCSVNGGNPLANISWICYDGMQSDNSTQFSAIRTITWFADNSYNSTCICKASHILGWTDHKNVKVHVYYEPYPPKCKIGHSVLDGGSVDVMLTSNFSITCESDGNPLPHKFTWILPSSDTMEGKTLTLLNVQKRQGGSHIIRAENNMTPSLGPNVTGHSTTSLDIIVHYGPMNPVFYFEPNGTNITSKSISVIKGEEIRIVCFADASPPPMYIWSDREPGQTVTETFDDDTNISCTIFNTIYLTDHNASQHNITESLQIEVLYPPSVPVFQFSTCFGNFRLKTTLFRLVSGHSLNVTCSAEARPDAEYRWNSSQSNQFYIPNVSKSDSATYVCKARNTMKTSYGKSVEGSNESSFDLDVLYPPTITNSVVKFVVIEGTNFSLKCEVSHGNPEKTSVFMTHQNIENGHNMFGHNISFTNISREYAGIFTCEINNTMKPTGCNEKYGIDTQQFHVDVQYKATVTKFVAVNYTVKHTEELYFECKVDSNPPANASIVSPNGTTLYFTNGDKQLRYRKVSSCLEDIGNFTCNSANKHNNGSSDSKHITVYVKCSPMYRPNYFPERVVKSNVGEQTMLNFSIFSNPLPTSVIWTNLSNNIQLPINTNGSDRVFINTNENMLSSVVFIKRTENWDFGNYSVCVENVIGNFTETFRIISNSDDTSTTTDPPFITGISANNIGAVVGGSVGVVIVAVVAIIILYRRVQRFKGTLPRANKELHLLKDSCHESGNMEMECFGNVLPINDETQKYEEEKNIYGNIQTKDAFEKSLTIKTLRDTVEQLKLDPLPLFKEFYTLHVGLQYDTKEALKPNNIAKNRYRSVYPYDASRVVLPFLRGDPDSDFINASYIDGYCKPRKYIAAQGPLENTINDTWRMIYSEDVKIIVMVTNLIETGKRKCFKYWPDDRATYGKCNVKLDQVEEYADFVVRHLTYSMEGTKFERQLIQCHYTSWPDKNVPATALSLVQFWRKVRQSEFVDNTPWMVHCSAGVGRTGTFIALDYLYDQGKVDGKLNVPETVNILRQQRISMVQTKEQYLYLHEAITELLDPVGQIFTPENSLRLRSTATEERKLNKEFKAITNSLANVKSDFEENDYDSKRMPDGLLPENICKSIDKTVIPDDLFRPLISSGNDFINAVFIPTYRDAAKYIVTQYPLQNTVLDFVRLLWDHSIVDVVLLDVGDEKLHCYWPQNKSPLCIGPFVISLLSVDEGKYCTIRRIDISLAERRQNKQTVVHQFTAWPGYLNLCETKTLTEFLQTISRIAGPVVVQCHDGYSRSGLFAALLSIVDRIKTDKEVAIADTVRLVKHRRQAAVTDVEQYQFCHEVVFEYLKGRENQTEEKENQEYVNMTFPKFL